MAAFNLAIVNYLYQSLTTCLRNGHVQNYQNGYNAVTKLTASQQFFVSIFYGLQNISHTKWTLILWTTNKRKEFIRDLRIYMKNFFALHCSL